MMVVGFHLRRSNFCILGFYLMGRLIWIWVNESINPIFEGRVDAMGFGIFSKCLMGIVEIYVVGIWIWVNES